MVTKEQIFKEMEKEEYDFLYIDEHLGDNIILLTLGGSKAYGTNVDTPEHTSDTDIRGIALNSKREILLRQDFEQIVDVTTDTTVYSFNKIIDLLSKTNPNTIEMLGCEPEQYLKLTNIGEELIENRHMFLSKIAVHTFGGYANAQLRRLQNALARDSYTQSEKENHIIGSVRSALFDLSERYMPFKFECEKSINNMLRGKNVEHQIGILNSNAQKINDKMPELKLYIDKSQKPNMDTEIFCDINLSKYPVRDYAGIFQEMNAVINAYDKLGKRNTKKDDVHLNKHAMHLVRLYLMAFDILEKEEIITYRKNDLDLLMSIRNGAFQKEDGSFRNEFFEMIDKYEKRLEYDSQNTSLPDHPDYDKINDFVADVNERIIKDEIFITKDVLKDDFDR